VLEQNSGDRSIERAYLPDARPVRVDDSMQAILPEVASNKWPVPVVDENDVFKGVVSKNRFLKTLHRTERQIEEGATEDEEHTEDHAA